MRVLSWNMNRRKNGCWDYLKKTIDPDIALLQETSLLDNSFNKQTIVEVEVKKNIRNSIYSSKYEFERINFPLEFNKDMICAKFSLENSNIFLISIYGNLDLFPFFTVFTGQISLMVTFLKNNFNAEHIIIGGDFNCDRRMDNNPTASRFAKRGERVTNLFFDSILNMGFKNCLRKFHSDYIETYRHHMVNSRYPWELDHMFCTNSLYDGLKKIEVMNNSDVIELSDHNPIIAEFDLSFVKQ